MKKIKERKGLNYSKIIGIFITLCIVSFFITFIYKFSTTTSSEAGPNQRWCANCQVFHNINETQTNEIWCNNCKTWHAPNQESSTQSIK